MTTYILENKFKRIFEEELCVVIICPLDISFKKKLFSGRYHQNHQGVFGHYRHEWVNLYFASILGVLGARGLICILPAFHASITCWCAWLLAESDQYFSGICSEESNSLNIVFVLYSIFTMINYGL